MSNYILDKHSIDELKEAFAQYGSLRKTAKALGICRRRLAILLDREMSSQPLYMGKHAAINKAKEKQDNQNQPKEKQGTKIKEPVYVTQRIKSKRYLITSAINNCQINAGYHQALKRFLDQKGAELLVVPLNYKNVSLYNSEEGYWWPHELDGHYIENDLILNDNLTLLGSLKVQATATNPLTGIHGYKGHSSCIVAHPRLAQSVHPDTLAGFPVVHVTTGSITDPSYTHTKAGYKSKEHHSIGGLYVEIYNNRFFHRWVEYDPVTASMYDLDMKITPDYVELGSSIDLLSFSDYHMPYHDPGVHEVNKELLWRLRPRIVTLEDLVDCLSISHHHIQDPFMRHRKRKTNQDDLRLELAQAEIFIKELLDAAPESQFYVKRSNHHDHIYRWLKSGRGADDPVNFDIYFELGHILSKKERFSKSGQVVTDDEVLQYCLDPLIRDRLIWLERTDSLRVHGIENSFHGHEGPSGTRGSTSSFKSNRFPVILGHNHVPLRDGIVMRNGTCATGLNYVKGPTAHMTGHNIVYPNGKVAIVHIIEDRYEL